MTQILNWTNHSVTPFRSYIHLYTLNILPFSFLPPLLTPVTSKGKKCRSKLLLKIKDKSKKKFKRHSQFSKIMGGKGSSPFLFLFGGEPITISKPRFESLLWTSYNKLVGVLVFLSLRFFPWFFSNFSPCWWFGIHIHLNPHTKFTFFSCGKELPSLTVHWVNKHLF